MQSDFFISLSGEIFRAVNLLPSVILLSWVPCCPQMKFQNVTPGAFQVRAPGAAERPARGQWGTAPQQSALDLKKKISGVPRLFWVAVDCGWLLLSCLGNRSFASHESALPWVNCLLCCNLAYQRYVPRRHHSLCLKAAAVGSWNELIWNGSKDLSGRNWRQLALCCGNVLKQAKSGNPRLFSLSFLSETELQEELGKSFVFRIALAKWVS